MALAPLSVTLIVPELIIVYPPADPASDSSEQESFLLVEEHCPRLIAP